MNSFGPLNLSVLIVLGIAILITVRLVYPRGNMSDDAVKTMLSICGVLFILLGVLGALATLIGAAVLVLVILVPAVLGQVVIQFRFSEQQALVWALAAAAERGIPLEEAARAFAQERRNAVGVKAGRLADALVAGVPLADALARVSLRLPTDEALAARVGPPLDCLGPMLRQAVRRNPQLSATLREIGEKYIYLAVVVLMSSIIVSFLTVSIMPIFKSMYAQAIGSDTPISTIVLAETGQRVAGWFRPAAVGVGNEWVVVVNVILAVLLGISYVVILLLPGVPLYFGWWPRDFPIMSSLSRRWDAAAVMRTLAWAVRKERALAPTLEFLSVHYPAASVRRKLARASLQVQAGADWCESLRAARVISTADAGVLAAAQRVGNLAWALDEMADSSVRRLTYRLRAGLTVVFPSFIILFGGFVLLVAWVFLGPLVMFIRSLA